MRVLALALDSDPRSEIIAVAQWQLSQFAAIPKGLLRFPLIDMTRIHADKKRENRSERYIRCVQRG